MITEYAAAFFMLAGAPKDAINVCLRQLNDWQLAFALARAVEGGTDGPLVKWVLSDTVIPVAFEGGHRWLATWAFWMLGKRDLAVRVLIVSRHLVQEERRQFAVPDVRGSLGLVSGNRSSRWIA